MHIDEKVTVNIIIPVKRNNYLKKKDNKLISLPDDHIPINQNGI